MFHSVIVPCDGSNLSARALEYGAAIARVIDTDLQAVAFPADADQPEPDTLAQLASIERPSVVTVRQRTKTVAEEVLAEASQASAPLVVVGSHGRARSAAYFGSVTTDLLRESDAPLLICGPQALPFAESYGLGGPCLLAIADDEPSAAVRRVASAWGKQFGSTIESVTVHGGGMGRTEKAVDIARLLVAECVAAHASVLVLETHAPVGSQRFLDPSVTSEIVKRSRVPVLALGPAVGSE